MSCHTSLIVTVNMRSFTLVLQVVGIALIAPSWGMPQGKHHKALVRPQQETFFAAADNDYALSPVPTPVEKPFRIIAAEKRPSETREEFLARKRIQEEELRRQAESAKYSFASSLNDRIQDGEHIRSETRDGLKTMGSYTYSDGYVRRTVEYVADENGYRVIKQTEEPIGDGPQIDLTGSADVAAYYDRSKLEYSITADDIRGYYTTEEEEEEEEATRAPFVAAFSRNSVPRVPVRTPAPVPATPRVPAPVPTPIAPVRVPAPAPVPAPLHVPGSVPAPIHVPGSAPAPEPVPTPKVRVSNDFDTSQLLRPVERHDIQTPLRPLPALRGQYFTQVHSL